MTTQHAIVHKLISIEPLALNIGKHNGPCDYIVSWLFAGGAYGGSQSSSAYIGGALKARSALRGAQISSSQDCNNAPPVVVGGNGVSLAC